jgi:hypothetical protein
MLAPASMHTELGPSFRMRLLALRGSFANKTALQNKFLMFIISVILKIRHQFKQSMLKKPGLKGMWGCACEKSPDYGTEKEPKTPNPRQQLAKVHRNPTQERVHSVSAGSFESISFQPMLALHMTDV